MSSIKNPYVVLFSSSFGSIDKELGAMSDEELVKQILASKNPALFGKLYDRYSERIYSKCYSFAQDTDEAQDLTQDVFLKLFTKLDSFRGEAKFSTWLFSFTYNFLVNYKKRDSAKKLGERWERLNKNDGHLAQLDDIDEEELFDLKAKNLEKALDLIEPADKALLLLKYQDDISIKDIQLLLNVNESAVKMRLKRAKIKLVKVHQKLQGNE
ncbi:RNA polymerase sigma factor [Sungkyunkwania multivorans]|uniref:RNA polymerase sigma factor n=1 Tax=Sungkyunkwania multivorans TaxID=1173618 RepID=A0ABW3D1U4_9FLAO